MLGFEFQLRFGSIFTSVTTRRLDAGDHPPRAVRECTAMEFASVSPLPGSARR
jgi:hypothetical protein